MNNFIKIKNLSSGYNGKEIIQNLSLDIPSKSFVAIIGLNGSGKSTFIKSICGKLSYKGSVENISKNAAYLGQKNQINFPITVREVLLMGLFRNKHFIQNYSASDEHSVFRTQERVK